MTENAMKIRLNSIQIQFSQMQSLTFFGIFRNRNKTDSLRYTSSRFARRSEDRLLRNLTCSTRNKLTMEQLPTCQING